MNWIKLPILLFCAITILSCANSGGEQDDGQQTWDTEFLPEGTERTSYAPNMPNANNFGEPRIDPPFWWTEMENDTLELLIYDREINDLGVTVRKDGIEILSISRVEKQDG